MVTHPSFPSASLLVHGEITRKIHDSCSGGVLQAGQGRACMRNHSLAFSTDGNPLWLLFAPDTSKSFLRVYSPFSTLILPEPFVMKLSPCGLAAGGTRGGSRVPRQRKTAPGNRGHAPRPSSIHTLYEHQENQKHVEYAHQAQYGAPVNIDGGKVKFFFADHGSTSLLFVISKCPYATKRPLTIVLLASHRKNKTTRKP